MTKAPFLLGSAVIAAATILYACSDSHALPSTGAQQSESLTSHSVNVSQSADSKDEPLGHSKAQQVSITVDPSHVGPPVTPLFSGATFPSWYNLTLSGLAQSISATHLALARFPAGAQVDIYNWQTGTDGPAGTPCAGNAKTESNIDAFMQNIAIPSGTQVSLGVNYGSNPQCNGGNTPDNAAAFVSHVVNTYGPGIVAYWELGNEQYAPGSIDCRQPGCRSSRDPNTFAKYEPAFYDAMHNAGAQNICIPVDANNPKSPWNAVVFAEAKYDCANMIYYPQRVHTSDSMLLYQAVPQLGTQIAMIKSQLAAANRPNTPILISAISSALGPYGKQSQSIVGALYADMAIGEAINDGANAMIWHAGFGSCDAKSQGGDFSKKVYGWQTTYGGAMIFSDGNDNNCPVTTPRGTLLATANALLTAWPFLSAGGNMVSVSVNGNPNIRAYASNKMIMIFNLSENQAAEATISINGVSSGAGGPSVHYNKRLYDQSKKGIWAPPNYTTVAPWKGSMQIFLRHWSVTVAPLT